MLSTNSNALTLSQAVNAQLAHNPTTNLDCDLLISNGGSPQAATTNPDFLDGLAGLCQRVAPLGGSEVGSSSSNDNSNVLLDYTLLLLEQERKKGSKEKNKKKILESNFSRFMLGSEQKQSPGLLSSISARWTFFMSGVGGTLNRDTSTEEDGYDSKLFNLLAGGTYVLNPENTFGAALTYQYHKGDYFGGGDFKDTAGGIRLMETYHPTDEIFIQTVAGLDTITRQRTRAAVFNIKYDTGTNIYYYPLTGSPYADYNYQQTELSLLSGYTFNRGRFTLTPQFGVNWLSADYGTYSESGTSGFELRFYNDKRKSLQSMLGIQATDVISTSHFVMIPQLNLNWKHEFADKSRKVNVSFVYDANNTMFYYDTPAADTNFFELGGGASFVFARGVQSYVRVQSVIGQQGNHNTTATLGLNIEL